MGVIDRNGAAVAVAQGEQTVLLTVGEPFFFGNAQRGRGGVIHIVETADAPTVGADIAPHEGGNALVGFIFLETYAGLRGDGNTVIAGIDPADSEFFLQKTVNCKQRTVASLFVFTPDVEFAVFVEPAGLFRSEFAWYACLTDDDFQCAISGSKFIAGKFEVFFQLIKRSLMSFSGKGEFDVGNFVFGTAQTEHQCSGQ